MSLSAVFLSEIKDSDLSLPHDLVADECGDILYVADRENGKVVFYRLSSMERLGGVHPLLVYLQVMWHLVKQAICIWEDTLWR